MYRVYQVQNGDTIDSIARKLNISSQELINLNSLSDQVMPGQLLVIPNQNSFFDTYVIKKGDNMYEIARNNNIEVEDLLRINGLNKDDYIYPEQEILIPRRDISVYITKENETLKDIENKLQTNLSDIMNQNDTIYVLPDQLIVYRG